MGRIAERLAASVLLGVLAGTTPTPALAGPVPALSAQSVSSPSPLRTFDVEKPAATAPESDRRPDRTPEDGVLLRSHDALRTTTGVGYVQGADWGAEVRTSGAVAGVQVQLDTLLTRGVNGLQMDRGSLLLADAESHWRVEAGDVPSSLRGPSRGVRLSWQAAGGRRPAIGVSTLRRGFGEGPPILSYQDQIRIGAQTLLDAEIASDTSFLLGTQLSFGRLGLQTFYRRNQAPERSADRGVSANVEIGRGLAVTGGVLRSDQPNGRSDWRSVAIHVPVKRWVVMTLERTYAVAAGATNTTTAAMAGLGAGRMRLFHRYQWGETAFERPDLSGGVGRGQLQSMAFYSPNARLDMSLQLATAWTETGRAQTWEELQSTVKVTRRTTLHLVTAVPDLLDPQRLRARLTQQLPRGFALHAEYGRLAAFQTIASELDRSRVRVMLSRTWDVATPARGGEVTGRVIDHAGNAVAGARVKLGPFVSTTGTSGSYEFKHVPRGDHELAIDESALPASYAWDGRRLTLAVKPSTRERIDLLVAPLNAIHGRVYADRNGNGRFDPGEAVANAVVGLGESVTATDRHGAYSFYNVWPGRHVVRLDAARLPPALAPAGPVELTVELGDERPVTGADFRVVHKLKPIIWRELIK